MRFQNSEERVQSNYPLCFEFHALMEQSYKTSIQRLFNCNTPLFFRLFQQFSLKILK